MQEISHFPGMKGMLSRFCTNVDYGTGQSAVKSRKGTPMQERKGRCFFVANVGTRTITYNADNLPTQIQYTRGSTVTNTYLYDAEGARWKKSVSEGG